MTEPWLTVRSGEAPLIVSFPHAGLEIPSDCAAGLVSADLAGHDADWYVDRLYVFAHNFGATTVHAALSRTVIDVNRDPSGASLYPGQATTGLVPTETFDGRPLYRDGAAPGIHAVQMELATRGCLPDEGDAPRWDTNFAKPIQGTLRTVLEACLTFVRA